MENIKENVKDWTDEEEITAYLAAILNKEAFDRSGLILSLIHISLKTKEKYFPLPMSLSALADYISVDRSSMMRELRKMKDVYKRQIHIYIQTYGTQIQISRPRANTVSALPMKSGKTPWKRCMNLQGNAPA